MLVRTGVLYHHSPPPQATLTGIALALKCRSASAGARALIGDDLKRGRISVTNFTDKQCAALVHVSASYIAAAALLADNEGARAAVRCGHLTVLDAARRLSAESLAAHIRRSNPDELLEAARDVGVTILWDGMIEPLLA